MRGCLRKVGIFLGVLIVLVAVLAVAFWLNWRRGNQLSEQAWNAYHAGNAADALKAYQEYLQVRGLSEREVDDAQGRVDELEGYLNASQLQQNGQADEAMAAYAAFLDKHNVWKAGYSPWHTPYTFLAGQTLVSLKSQQAQQAHERGDFARAIEIYAWLLALEPLAGDDCSQFSYDPTATQGLCQEAEAAITEGRAAALAATPKVLGDWGQTLKQGGNYLEFVKTCERILGDHPEMLRTSAGALAQAALDEARTDLPAWLAQNPAVPTLDFGDEIARDAEGKWVLTTRLAETGGKVGYTLKASGWIIDAQGEKWGIWGLSEITRGPVTVPAGGETEDSYRFQGDEFVDGYAVFSWEGTDEGGHPISLEEKVHLLP